MYNFSNHIRHNNLSLIPHFCGHGIGEYFHGPPEIIHFRKYAKFYTVFSKTRRLLHPFSVIIDYSIYYIYIKILRLVFVVVDLPLLRVPVKGSDNPITSEQPCQACLPPDQQRHHSLGRHPEVQYVV